MSITVCIRCGQTEPARECPCGVPHSGLALVTMAAAVLAGERGKTIGADEMRVAAAMRRVEVEA